MVRRKERMMHMIFNTDEYILDRELQYHLNRAVYWYKQKCWSLAYDEMYISQGIIYAAVALHFIDAYDAIKILNTLRTSQLTLGIAG